MASTATVTHWALKGQGYEFCNCDFGCGCNFGGFPNSKDGSCRAFVGMAIDNGSCGDVDLSGVKCAAIFDWPKAIHEGNGKCVFVVEPSPLTSKSKHSANLHREIGRHALGTSRHDLRSERAGEGQDYDRGERP